MLNESVQIAPSILSADFTRLGEDIRSVSNADYIHYDVMDGHFVPNLSFGVSILRQVKACSDIPVDAHLMVSNPEESVPWYLDAGADVVTFHWEAQIHAERLVNLIHERGARAGISLNPATPVNVLDSIIDELDLVLIMTVNPGYGGQSFIEGSARKIRALRSLCDERGVSPLIEVDGGIGQGNAEEVVRAGARLLVAGSAVFKGDHAANVEAIRAAGQRGLALMA
ncbi:ribulose-phosphate 3-epimerase [Olsenella urininfantis]|uniref:ribulose-phosphate 3-epimerase n=1 Tax=Olsenella urininfantis TaxID=1871033 RepID=UPI000984D318|nr:ribulose-phosphate 3-epimerase [Olsenella urininfantis]